MSWRRPTHSTRQRNSQTCRDARAHAHALIDGTLTEADRDRAQARLDTCPVCPATLQAAAGAVAVLQFGRDPDSVSEPPRIRLAALVREADAGR